MSTLLVMIIPIVLVVLVHLLLRQIVFHQMLLISFTTLPLLPGAHVQHHAQAMDVLEQIPFVISANQNTANLVMHLRDAKLA